MMKIIFAIMDDLGLRVWFRAADGVSKWPLEYIRLCTHRAIVTIIIIVSFVIIISSLLNNHYCPIRFKTMMVFMDNEIQMFGRSFSSSHRRNKRRKKFCASADVWIGFDLWRRRLCTNWIAMGLKWKYRNTEILKYCKVDLTCETLGHKLGCNGPEVVVQCTEILQSTFFIQDLCKDVVSLFRPRSNALECKMLCNFTAIEARAQQR